MIKSSRIQIPILTLASALLVMIPGSSSALGLGAYFEFVHGEGEVDYDVAGADDVDFDADKFGFGFALDTNVAANRLFNYRMTLGYQNSNRDFDRINLGGLVLDLDDIDADGVSFDNAFGFALWRGPQHRLWAGPAIRLGVDVFDTGTNDVDIVDVSIGGGAVVGLNIHAGRHVSVGVTASYQYLHIEQIVHTDFAGDDESDSFSGHEHIASLKVVVLFRFPGDQYN